MILVATKSEKCYLRSLILLSFEMTCMSNMKYLFIYSDSVGITKAQLMTI